MRNYITTRKIGEMLKTDQVVLPPPTAPELPSHLEETSLFIMSFYPYVYNYLIDNILYSACFIAQYARIYESMWHTHTGSEVLISF